MLFLRETGAIAFEKQVASLIMSNYGIWKDLRKSTQGRGCKDSREEKGTPREMVWGSVKGKGSGVESNGELWHGNVMNRLKVWNPGILAKLSSPTK